MIWYRIGQVVRSSFSKSVLAVMAITTAAGISNFASNIIAVRELTPGMYAEYGTFLALIGILLLPGSVVTTLAARIVGQLGTDLGYIRLRRYSTVAGAILAVVGVFTIVYVYQYGYGVKTAWWIPTLVGALLLFSPLEAFYIGVLQGQKRFAFSQLGRFLNAIVKIVGLGYLLVVGASLDAALLVVLSSMAFSIVYVLVVARRTTLVAGQDERASLSSEDRRLVPSKYASLPFAITLGNVLFFNLDMLVAKSVFRPHMAGLFAALTLTGKILALGTGPISFVLYPHLMSSTTTVQRWRLIVGAWTITLLVSGIVLISVVLFSNTITRLLFGPAYGSIAPLLVIYGIAFTFYSLTNVTFTALLEQGSGWLWVNVVGGGSFELITLLIFHRTLMSFTIGLAGSMVVMWSVSTGQAIHNLRSRRLEATGSQS